jgi:hypothetical protein
MEDIHPAGARPVARELRPASPPQDPAPAALWPPPARDDIAPIPIPTSGRALLRFSSGSAGRPVHQRLMTAFNEHDVVGVKRILGESERELTPFQSMVLWWLISAMEGLPSAAAWQRRAELLAATPAERAVICEDAAALGILRGDMEEARRRCEEGIALCPTSQGLWVNLLVTLDRLGEDAAIEALLERLPAIFDLSGGALGHYLMNDPAFDATMCNGG